MSPRHDERELREALHQAHGDDAAPDFARSWQAAEARLDARAPRSTLALRWLLAPAGAAAALALTVSICVGVQERGAAPRLEGLAYSGSEWSAPTDFLLETPGTDWLGSTPSFGVEVDLELNLEPDNEERSP